MLHHHPSPPASSERRQVTVVGREKALSFNQLDGQEDISLLDAVPTELGCPRQNLQFPSQTESEDQRAGAN